MVGITPVGQKPTNTVALAAMPKCNHLGRGLFVKSSFPEEGNKIHHSIIKISLKFIIQSHASVTCLGICDSITVGDGV